MERTQNSRVKGGGGQKWHGMFCPGQQKKHGMFCLGWQKLHGMFCPGLQIYEGCFVQGVKKWHGFVPGCFVLYSARCEGQLFT